MIWSNFLVPVTTRAAAFWTVWSLGYWLLLGYWLIKTAGTRRRIQAMTLVNAIELRRNCNQYTLPSRFITVGIYLALISNAYVSPRLSLPSCPGPEGTIERLGLRVGGWLTSPDEVNGKSQRAPSFVTSLSIYLLNIFKILSLAQ